MTSVGVSLPWRNRETTWFSFTLFQSCLAYILDVVMIGKIPILRITDNPYIIRQDFFGLVFVNGIVNRCFVLLWQFLRI